MLHAGTSGASQLHGRSTSVLVTRVSIVNEKSNTRYAELNPMIATSRYECSRIVIICKRCEIKRIVTLE